MGSLALFLFLLLAIPYAIDYAVETWLEDHGATKATIQDVDFNPFSGRLQLDNLQVETSRGLTLHIWQARVNLQWLSLVERRLRLSEVFFGETRIEVRRRDDGTWLIGGLSFPIGGTQEAGDAKDGAEEVAPWDFGVDELLFKDIFVGYGDPDIRADVAIKSFELRQLESWKVDEPALLNVKMTVNGGAVDMNARLFPFAADPGGKAQIQVTDLELEPFGPLFAKHGITALRCAVGTDINLEALYRKDSGLRLNVDGSLTLSETHLVNNDVLLFNERLFWQGNGQVMIPASSGQTTFSVGGGLNLMSTRVSMGTENTVLSPQQTGAHEKDTGEGSDHPVEPEQSKPPAHPLLALGELAVNGISFDYPGSLKVTDVTIRNMDVSIVRDETGKLLLPSAAKEEVRPEDKTSKIGETQVETMTSDAPNKLDFHVGSIQLTGDSFLKFEDRSVKPVFLAKLQPLEASITDVDSTTRTASPFKLEATLDSYCKIGMQGNVRPFAEAPTFGLEGRIEALELPPLSSYTGQYLGYNLGSGHMDADIKVSVTNGQLDAKTEMFIRKLTLRSKDSDETKSLTEQLAMPIDKALDLLRDGDGNISLKVNADGDIQDPKFDYSNIINQALGKAIKVAAVKYLKVALQPWGSLITVAQLAGKAIAAGKAMALRFEPVRFAPSAADITPDSAAYLDKLAKVMHERPGIHLSLCGTATEKDRAFFKEPASAKTEATGNRKPVAQASAPETETEVLPLSPAEKEELKALAQKRSLAVKDYLVSKGDVDAQRLLVCHPSLNDDKEAQGVVDVFL